MADFFAVLSSIAVVISLVFYYLQAKRRESDPNPISWLVWSIAAIINAFSYFKVVDDDPLQAAVAFILAICLCTVFVYLFFRKKFIRLKWNDVFGFLACVAVGWIWWETENPRLANLLIQFVVLIGFIETVRTVLQKRSKENYVSWSWGLLAYTLLTISVFFSWKGDWLELAFPVSRILANSIMVWITRK